MKMHPAVHTETFQSEVREIARRARQMWGLIPRRQRWMLGTAVAIMIGAGSCNTVIPLLLGDLVDAARDVFNGERAPAGKVLGVVAPFLLWIGAAYLLREFLNVVRRLLVEGIGTRLEKHLFVRLVAHLLMADLSTLTHEKVGTLHGRILRNVGGSVRFLRIGFLEFVPALIVGLLALATTVAKQPFLGLAMMGVIPVSLYLTWRQLISQKGVRLDLLHSREDMDGTVVEQLGGIDSIRAAGTHKQEIGRVTKSAEQLRRKELRHHFVMSLYGSAKALCEGFFHILVLGLAVYLAATGRISLGDILTFSLLFLGVMAPLAEVHRVLDEGHESSLLIGELLQMLSQPVDRSYRLKEAQQPRLETESVIALDNLQVHYPLPVGGQRKVLDGTSLTIRRGEIVGVAGRSGCGKSTFLRALLRLVHPTAGHALLGGVPLSSISGQSISQLVGYVGQTPFVFSGTIEENIAYERSGASRAEIERAAQLACLDRDIREIPGGYDARIVERGQNLSGGQRQRLALARVFLKDPPIIILDEATSALDTISEGQIQQWIAASRGNRTVIMVAHRLSTLLYTDRILVFEDGRIVESGPYHDLLLRGGAFAELVASAGGTPVCPQANETNRNFKMEF